jgi:hypothetical protein
VAMSAFGTKPSKRALCYLSAFGNKADMHERAASTILVGYDPKRTSSGLKSRNAAICWRVGVLSFGGSAAGSAANMTTAKALGLTVWMPGFALIKI